MKKSVKVSLIVVLAVVVTGGAAVFLISSMLGNSGVEIYYTQIDNGRIKENYPTGGVIDPTGGLAYSYTLMSYDESGEGKDIEFGMSRQLREDAFIRLEVLPVRGVVNWAEVQYDELPAAVQAHYSK